MSTARASDIGEVTRPATNTKSPSLHGLTLAEPDEAAGEDRSLMHKALAHAVACANCRHFRRIDHPHLGHCAVDEPEAIAGLWDTDRRGCMRWLPLEQRSEGPLHGD